MRLKMWCVLLAAVLVMGCQNPQDPVNAGIEKFGEATSAIFAKVGKDTLVSTGQVNGNMSLKRPGYKVKGIGGVFHGVIFECDITIEGIEGQMMGGFNLGPRPPGEPIATEPQPIAAPPSP